VNHRAASRRRRVVVLLSCALLALTPLLQGEPVSLAAEYNEIENGNLTCLAPFFASARCKVKDKVVNAPHYEVGATYQAPSVPDGLLMSVVQISIDPKNLNRDDLLRLALKLQKDFCKEERLFAVLFDDAAYIKHNYVSDDAGFHQAEESKRGYYYVDRKTGEEYIEYCTVRNILRTPEKRVRIELGPPTKRKPDDKDRRV
jgi:hypothetical protein